MANQNSGVESSVESNGVEKSKRIPVTIIEYPTKEECEANRPVGADAKNAKDEYVWKPYKVTRPNGVVTWIWAVGSVNAASTVARIDGYTVSLGEGRGPRQSSGVSFAKMASLDDSILASLGLNDVEMAKIREHRKVHDTENAQASKATQAAHQQNVKQGKARKLAQ